MASKKAKKTVKASSTKRKPVERPSIKGAYFKDGVWAGQPIQELTPEQDALCDEIAAEYINDLSVSREPDMAVIQRWLEVVYKLYDLKVPARIEIALSPEAALKLASELTGEKHDSTDWCGTGDGGWVSHYDYFERIGVLTDEENADVRALRDFGRVAWDSVLLDECAIVIRRPVGLHVDQDGNLHRADGPCIEWADGEKDYAWHGTWVPERMIVDPRSYTSSDYRAITNTEQRRAISEINGWSWISDLLGASVADTWTDPATLLMYELLAFDGGKLLRMRSPALKGGAQPTYIEPVHEDLRTARAARKWQATTWTPRECERDPDLRYEVEA